MKQIVIVLRYNKTNVTFFIIKKNALCSEKMRNVLNFDQSKKKIKNNS